MTYRSEHPAPKNTKGNRIEIQGDIALVYLNSRKHPGMVSTILARRVPLVAPYTWWPFWSKNTKSFYACSTDANHQTVMMHRLIMDAPDDMQVDHVHHQTLDNRDAELIVKSNRENNHNKRNHGHLPVGVYFPKRDGRFLAQIWADGARRHLGYYDSPLLAGAVVNLATSLVEPSCQPPNPHIPIVATIHAVSSRPARAWLSSLTEALPEAA